MPDTEHVENERHSSVAHDGRSGINRQPFQLLAKRLDYDFLGIEDVSLAVREQLLVLDDQLRVQGGSQSFYTALQAPPAQAAGTKLAEIGRGQWNIPALLTRLNELPKAGGEFDNLELELDFPPLGRRTMLLGARRLMGQGAQDGMILLSIRDATGRKLVEADTRDSLARCHATLATIGCAVIVTDPAGSVTFINPAAEKITGWRHIDAFEKDVTAVFKIVNERSSQPEENVIAKSIREREVGDLAKYTVLIARDGSEWPIDGNTAPFFDAAGRLAGVVLVFHDISNRRHTEQELEVSEIRYRRLFESAHDGILILDATTSRVVDVNPFMGDLLGYPREHFLGKELWEIGVFQDADMSKFPQERDSIVTQLKGKKSVDRRSLLQDSILTDLLQHGKVKKHQAVIDRLVAQYRS